VQAYTGGGCAVQANTGGGWFVHAETPALMLVLMRTFGVRVTFEDEGWLFMLFMGDLTFRVTKGACSGHFTVCGRHDAIS
jgi:hypothetical protein